MNANLARAVCVLMCFWMLCGSAAGRPRFKIENFTFEWQAAKKGDTEILIVKTDNETKVRIDQEGYYVEFKSNDVDTLANVLAKLDTTREGVSNEVPDCVVHVRRNDQGNLMVGFLQGNSDVIRFNPKELPGLVKLLKESTAQAKYFDQAVDSIQKQPGRQRFKIENFTFEWQAAKKGDTKILIVKTDNETKVRLSQSLYVEIDPNTTAELINVLTNLDTSREGVERVGQCDVRVGLDPSRNLMVGVTRQMSDAYGIWVSPKEVPDLIKLLKESTAQAAFFDKTIDAALKH